MLGAERIQRGELTDNTKTYALSCKTERNFKTKWPTYDIAINIDDFQVGVETYHHRLRHQPPLTASTT